MKTILVTGGAGFIGSNFIRYYLDKYKDDHVINLDKLTYAGNKENLWDIENNDEIKYTFIKGDIGNQELINHIMNVYNPTIIVNFAAESHNSLSFKDPNAFLETNAAGVLKMLQVVKDYDIERFHHISTCEVFGDIPLDSDEKFSEDNPYNPKTPYNASKAAGDHTVRAFYHSFGVPITISICSNNYGPYQFPEKVIPLFVSKIMQNQEIPVYESSENKREWIHVKDHCKAIDLILTKGRVGETYNIGTGVEKSVDELVEVIFNELSDYNPQKKIVPNRPQHDTRYLLDSSKIKNELGWTPEINFDDGIKATIEWYKSNIDWWKALLDKQRIDEEDW